MKILQTSINDTPAVVEIKILGLDGQRSTGETANMAWSLADQLTTPSARALCDIQEYGDLQRRNRSLKAVVLVVGKSVSGTTKHVVRAKKQLLEYPGPHLLLLLLRASLYIRDSDRVYLTTQECTTADMLTFKPRLEALDLLSPLT